MKTKSLYPIIVCADIDASIKFYTDTMGFEVKHNPTTKVGSRVVILGNAAGNMLELMEATENGPVKLEPGLYGMRMNVDDIEAAKAELEQAGCKIISAPMDTGLGKIMPVIAPDGVKLTIIQHIKK